MTLPATISQIMLDTILDHLAGLFRTGDPAAARKAALHMLTEYAPQTTEQLALAADIVGFRLHALEALGKACEPNLSLSAVIRLRGSAVSLNRQAHKSQRKLDQLQKTSTAQAKPPQPQPLPAQPKPQPTWTANDQKRHLAQKIAENSRRNAATHHRPPDEQKAA